MVVCKFFQQGYCRFGKNCRYDHIYGSKYSYQAPQIQQAQQAAAPPQPAGTVTDEQLVQQVQSDVQAALRGGQWILSCYSPFKEKPIFPGMTDLSPEEARLFIYEAKNNNNIGEAIAYMNNLFKEYRLKYEQLLQPNINIIKVLRCLYKGEIVASPFSNAAQNSAPQTMFSNANNAASSIFRSAVQTTPVLSPNANTGQSIFSQGQQNMFNTQAPDPAKQLFSQATNVFGPAQPPSNIFAQNQTDAKSIFATAVNSNISPPQQNNPSSIFSVANQNFQTAPNPSPFGQATPDSDDSGIYSKMEELTDVDLEAFKADSFTLGLIPEVPPPRDLCMAPSRSPFFR